MVLCIRSPCDSRVSFCVLCGEDVVLSPSLCDSDVVRCKIPRSDGSSLTHLQCMKSPDSGLIYYVIYSSQQTMEACTLVFATPIVHAVSAFGRFGTMNELASGHTPGAWRRALVALIDFVFQPLTPAIFATPSVAHLLFFHSFLLPLVCFQLSLVFIFITTEAASQPACRVRLRHSLFVALS